MAIPAAAAAQQLSESANGNAMPLSFLLDDALDAHSQAIQENIFEYEFNASASDPAVQSALVQERSDELAAIANEKKAFLTALLKHNGTIPDDQVAEMAGSVGKSVDRLNGWSKKLEEHAAGLAILKGHKAYTDSVQPMMSDISDAKGMSDKLKDEMKKSSSGNNNGQSNNNGKKN